MDFLEKLITDTLHRQLKYMAKASYDKIHTKEECTKEEIDKYIDNLDKSIDESTDLLDFIGKGKIIEAIIGIILLIPPILGVVAFTLNLFDWGGEFAKMSNLSSEWSSSAPIFLGLMALAGVYLIKDNIKYFIPDKNKKEK